MPFRTYTDREIAKIAVKDAAAEGRLGDMTAFRMESNVPVCAIGHIATALGFRPQTRHTMTTTTRLWLGEFTGLTVKECESIESENDWAVATSATPREQRRVERAIREGRVLDLWLMPGTVDPGPILSAIDKIPVGHVEIEAEIKP